MLYEHLCFHAQQAAEKAIKAVLVHHGIPVAKSHDLAFLLAQLPVPVTVPVSLVSLPLLTKYAVQLRYPGEVAALTAREYRAAVRLAALAIEWAASVVSHS